MSKLLELLEYESQELAHRFNKSRLEGQGTPSEVSDRRESVVKTFFEKYFPFPHRVAKGNIIDSENRRSASIDCIILSPDHPYTVSDGNHFSIIFADGVDFAIEVKPDLCLRDEVYRALNQIATVKRLKKKRSGFINGGQPFQFSIPGIIFSITAPENPQTLLDNIINYYEKEKIKRSEQFDIIFVNSKYLILNNRKGSYVSLNSQLPQEFIIGDSGIHTLATLLVFMNQFPLSAPKITDSVIGFYLKHNQQFGNMRWLGLYSKRLQAIEDLPDDPPPQVGA